jgi:hypothetical protein
LGETRNGTGNGPNRGLRRLEAPPEQFADFIECCLYPSDDNCEQASVAISDTESPAKHSNTVPGGPEPFVQMVVTKIPFLRSVSLEHLLQHGARPGIYGFRLRREITSR